MTFHYSLSSALCLRNEHWPPRDTRKQLRYHARRSYHVLARSWRPQLFTDLIGQDPVVQTLRNALTADTLGHAYLFAGLRGVGKTTVARLIARAVNCEKGPTPEPCGVCPSCTEIAAGSSLDVVELDGASNRGIDDVRELRELLRYRPTRDRFRVIIIDEVHMLTREAFNALLKSLEEPPSYIMFIFATTERHRVPATILSRCQGLDFRPVPAGLITERLLLIAKNEGFSLTRGAAMLIARSAAGSVRDGLSLLDQLRAFADDNIDEEAVGSVLGVPRFEQVVELVAALVEGQAAQGLRVLREQLGSGHDATVLYQEIGRFLTVVLHAAVDANLESDLDETQTSVVRELGSTLGVTALTRMLGLWVEQEGLLRSASNRELALEVSCLRLARWPAVQLVEAILDDQDPGNEAGGPGEHSPRQQSSSGGVGGSRTKATDEELTALLWPSNPRLAGALESAVVVAQGDTLSVQLPASAAGLAQFLSRDDSQKTLREACRELRPEVQHIAVEVAGAESGSEVQPSLKVAALEDSGVQLAQRILGGDVVHVKPDRGSSKPGETTQ
ncbi:MAG: DNA polymerase III subunit gamma/tau [bacterium]|nr:DNA polymerase III subunit gamma/tau [bacterium]